jgi:RNA recognition motif-containing protein
MLYEEFSKYGEIVDWVVMKNPETGASRGFGFITYKDAMGAESALGAGPFKMDGKSVGVNFFSIKKISCFKNNGQKVSSLKCKEGTCE